MYIDLAKCYEITDSGIENLKHLSSLKYLNLSSCAGITDITPVGKLIRLHTLALLNFRELTEGELEALKKCPSLRSFYCSQENTDQAQALRAANQDLVIQIIELN